MKTKPNVSWNVWIWEFNRDRLEQMDVVPRFVDLLRETPKARRPKTQEELAVWLNDEALYRYWSKCEYEMIIHDWPAGKNDAKVDVYQQLKLNWSAFVDLFWTKVYVPLFMRTRTSSRKKASA